MYIIFIIVYMWLDLKRLLLSKALIEAMISYVCFP